MPWGGAGAEGMMPAGMVWEGWEEPYPTLAHLWGWQQSYGESSPACSLQYGQLGLMPSLALFYLGMQEHP